MSAAVALPVHQLSESPTSRSISIGPWLVTAATHPISNAAQSDALHARTGFPLPEMTFGANLLRLEYTPGWAYEFTTPGALDLVKNGELWLQSRTDPSSALPMPNTVPTKPYDWTYTTVYPGHQPSSSLAWTPADPENPAHTIPMSELTRPDPILFYAEIPLFEDELHDNGSSMLIVRIRVMPTFIFILARFTLRVDNVLFRTHDTRIYHTFAASPPLVLRETSGWEAPYDLLKRRLPQPTDLTPLTDPAFIARVLTTELPKRTSQRDGATTGWRGLGTRLEVLHLPQ
ncbi:type 2A phosphatase activator TIP41 [Infundibulicybe gibba]|nr:type 2A phosphatase activator TIP41 [Infundibulicybe gibba]